MEENLNSLEVEILKILEIHEGRESAIPRDLLVQELNSREPLFPRSERKIRETIKHLVTQHGRRIGSCHGGYFMAVTAEELEGVCKYYRSYGLSMFYTESKLRKMHLAELLGQLSFEQAKAEGWIP